MFKNFKFGGGKLTPSTLSSLTSCNKVLRLTLFMFFAICFATVNAQTTVTLYSEDFGSATANTDWAKASFSSDGTKDLGIKTADVTTTSKWKISKLSTGTCTVDGSSKSSNAYCGSDDDLVFNFGDKFKDYTNVKISFNYCKGSGGNKDNSLKLYVSSDGGTTYGDNILENVPSYASGSWHAVSYSIDDVSNLAIKFTTSTNTNRIDDIVITGESSASGITKCATPTFSPSSGETFTNTLTVTATTSTDGAKVVYNTDNGTTFTDFPSDGLTISETTTIYAKAVDPNGSLSESSVVSATYTKVEVLDGVAALKAAITSTTENSYYVKFTNAVVTHTAGSMSSIEQDETGVIYFNSSTKLNEGATYNGVAKVTGKLYNGYVEVTSISELESTEGAAPTLPVLTLSELLSDFDKYDARAIKVKDLNVSSSYSSGNSVNVSDEKDNSIVVYKASSVTVTAGDNVSVIGFPVIYKNKSTEKNEILVNQQTDYIELGTDVELTISPSGYSSLYYGDTNLALPEGVTGYVCDYTEGSSTISATEVYYKDATSLNAVPKDCAVILKGTANTAYTLEAVDDDDVVFEKDYNTNILLGTDEAKQITADEGKYLYYFGYGSDNTPGFFMDVANGAYVNNEAHKAYISISYNADAAGAKPLVLDFGTTDAINGMSSAQESTDGKVYTLSGMQVSGTLQKGIYIKNGRKFIVK